MSRLNILFLLWLILQTSLTAQHIVIHSENTRDTQDSTSWFSIPDRLNLYIFQSADVQLQIIDNGDYCSRYQSIQEAMTANHCTAGVNGGFFSGTPERHPIGLLISDKTLISKIIDKSFVAAGVLYDTGTDIKLERRHKLSHAISNMHQAIQSGPFLVEYGKPVTGLNKTRRARRTFIATDGKGTWCLGCSSSLTLHDLATWLVTVKFPNGNRIHAALNMDGGTSSCFWNSTDGTLIPAFRHVRNYVGIRPRNER